VSSGSPFFSPAHTLPTTSQIFPILSLASNVQGKKAGEEEDYPITLLYLYSFLELFGVQDCNSVVGFMLSVYKALN
jgi:hypothetical protein